MATTPAQNSHNKDIFLGDIIYPTSSVNVVNQGDIVMNDATLNSGNGGLRAVATQADMATFAGIAKQSSVLNSLGDLLPTVAVAFKNIFNLKTTAADVYKHGSKVFFNETADAQTVTVSTNAGARTVAVGYVVLPNENLLAGNLTVTGASGVTIPVAILANFPAASLA